MSMQKFVFLSHSTHENLTRDWVNTTPLFSSNTICPGRGNNEAPACHRMIYGWDYCKRDTESGTAQCQADIKMEYVWLHIARGLNHLVKKAA